MGPRRRRIVLAVLVAGLSALRASDAPVEAGPFVHEFPLTLGPGRRVEAAGPFFSEETTPDAAGWSFSPFVAFQREAAVEREQCEVLYPLLTYDRYGAQYRCHILELVAWSGGGDTSGGRSDRFTIFPFYFSQRSEDPARRYRAVLPFYGTIRNRLFRDEIRFAAMPLWVRTRKRDVVTDNYLAPFFHVRTGAALGWQLWPLYGQESRAPITRTNAISDLAEVVPGHEKRFALWPVWFSERLGIGSDNPVTNRLFLPFLARKRSPAQDNTTVLWPFFTHTVDRERRFEEWGAPWPFVGWADGEGKHARRFWPLYAHAANTNVSSTHVLWPAYTHRRLLTENLEREQTRGLFYIWSDVAERNRQTGAEYRRRSLWPLWYHWRDREGRERLQVLALAEGAFPHNEGIRRIWSPVWSLYRQESDARTGASCRSILWNLWRTDVRAGSARTSALFGLVKTERTSQGRKWRFFWTGYPKGPETGPAAK